ncbi:MAG: hypothetical protein U5K81_12515 [Trueperaceae bacterium]|nr:hypothetical protein [Trueperaceae bacterium]
MEPGAPAAAPEAGATATADDPFEMVQRLFPGRMVALDPGSSPSEDDAATDTATVATEPTAAAEADADAEDATGAAPAADPEA